MPKLVGSPFGEGPVAYLDIETTGLCAARDQVTVVGIASAFGRARKLEQYFVDAPQSEAAVIRAVAARLEAFAGVVVYNGVSFDLPFLRTRARKHGIRFPWVEAWDLLGAARTWRRQRGQPQSCRLQAVMQHLGIRREDHSGGSEVVDAYAEWLDSRDTGARDLILDHNADDVLLLPDLVPHLMRTVRSTG